jgi:hypothetical protein
MILSRVRFFGQQVRERKNPEPVSDPGALISPQTQNNKQVFPNPGHL